MWFTFFFLKLFINGLWLKFSFLYLTIHNATSIYLQKIRNKKSTWHKRVWQLYQSIILHCRISIYFKHINISFLRLDSIMKWSFLAEIPQRNTGDTQRKLLAEQGIGEGKGGLYGSIVQGALAAGALMYARCSASSANASYLKNGRVMKCSATGIIFHQKIYYYFKGIFS